ncbi:bifunctional 2-polyprenyl-6-hydroxyphenol methylase/3-demethylubiquinol 3-O-methyltransferase UbiG [Siccirubricoccus sp. G192]|uniref:class I SAM-dependent methyltransferase n=1 Tax=Siccirubricoccus sp. G192 TaxID=2849651 RepID=UPI001C2BD65F|nr:class I SAM-dependent methyltransferase [Siccirubricoccus sp. G192]MBV1799790.1 class I SAM-dependent methyltransferase [Siccirubricoccus sp. G192]
MAAEDWRAANQANWDERVAIHLGPGSSYDLGPLRAGQGRLDAIVAAELGPVAGLRVLHLQCHFGKDTLVLAQQGAAVVGLDFSAPAITAARGLAGKLGLANRARFVEADLYDAPRAIPEPAGFDLVFVTWGALPWLPDIAGWARIVAGFLRPGGRLYLAEGHPAAFVFDDATETPDGRPGWFVPYFQREALVLDEPGDYADGAARLQHRRTHTWMHPLAEVLGALAAAGLSLDWLHEHPRLPWRMFRGLVQDAEGLWTWPDRPWLPLGYSLQASLQGGPPPAAPGARPA